MCRGVPNVMLSHCLGKLLCCHYTTAAKSQKDNSFAVYSAFWTIAIDAIDLHRFTLLFTPKWRQVETDAATSPENGIETGPNLNLEYPLIR